MRENKKSLILHIFNDPKFSKIFFEFLLRNNVNLDNHFLFHYRCKKSTCNNFGMSAIFAPHFFSPIPNLLMLKPLFQSDKIIIHSLASPFLLFYLYLFPKLAHKCYWTIWGKDLYFYHTLPKKYFYHRIYEYFRKQVIKNIGHIITFSPGDYELSKKWYNSNAKWHKSFMYPSNLFVEIGTSEKCSESIVILAGNSADPSNNHQEIFKLLEKYKQNDIEIICPLSYGDMKYADKIIHIGNKIFGEKFKPITELLPFENYLEILKTIDIGIFAHNRQQATGNIVSLLGMGKKVYIRDDITTWDLFNSLGVEIFKLGEININQLDHKTKTKNQAIIKNIFSADSLLKQWNEIENDIP